jgi:Na+/proline symporter
MSWIDWTVVALFLGWTVWDGLRRAGGKRTLEGYFAGGRTIPWWAAGLSVMASQISAITVIGLTGQAHDAGMEIVQLYLGLPLAMILIGIFLVPLYRRLPILTAYEYLERRFGPATRALTSLVFLVSRCLALGVVLVAPSVVLSAMTGIPPQVTILVICAVTTIYTFFGGVAAVIWVDVKQMAVIVGGLVLCLGLLLWKLLPEIALGEGFSVLGSVGKLNAIEYDPRADTWLPQVKDLGGSGGSPPDVPVRSFWKDKYNFWSGLFGGLFLHLAYFGCDQIQVQRILTSKNQREARLALLLSAFVKLPMQVLVAVIGVLLWLYFALHPGPLLFNCADRETAAAGAKVAALEERYAAASAERRELVLKAARERAADPATLMALHERAREIDGLRSQARRALHGKDPGDTNYVFMHFLLTQLPVVVLGLMMAAVFAAAMSSSDAAFNALSSATIVDFYKRLLRPGASESECIVAAKVVTLLWGVLAGLSALWLMDEGGASLLELVNRVGSYSYGLLLGIFMLAVVWRRAGPRAGVCGLLGGAAAIAAVHFVLDVEFLWYNVVGCAGVLLAGIVASWFERR